MIVAGTGHRPDKLGGYAPHLERATYAMALTGLYETRPEWVISGMALGWDMALAEAADTMGIPFTAAIPFRGQDRFWNEKDQDRYHRLLGRASEVKIVTHFDPLDALTAADVGAAMQRRNVWMVNNADLVLALWDGSNGGTRNCIRFADQAGVPVLNLWESFWINRIPF